MSKEFIGFLAWVQSLQGTGQNLVQANQAICFPLYGLQASKTSQFELNVSIVSAVLSRSNLTGVVREYMGIYIYILYTPREALAAHNAQTDCRLLGRSTRHKVHQSQRPLGICW